MKYKYPFIRPAFPDPNDVAEDYKKIVDSNWFTNFGPFEVELSNKAAEYVGKDIHATTVANATLGIQIAVKHFFNYKKKYVIMPSFTFAAGAEVLISEGFTPVFIDIMPDTLQPSIQQAKQFIEENITDMAGILLCNIFGVGNKDIGIWENISESYDIALVIDTAAGFGSYYTETEKVGGRGDCEIFSLHATKPFAVGEGGLILSRSNIAIKEIRKLENFGFGKNREVETISTNAKLQELTCAIGLRQLLVLDQRLTKRREILAMYKKRLLDQGYGFQENDDLSTVAFASIIAKDITKAKKTTEALASAGVEIRHYYNPPLHTHKIFMGKTLIADNLRTTDDICKKIISLPVLEDMRENDVEYIANVCR